MLTSFGAIALVVSVLEAIVWIMAISLCYTAKKHGFDSKK
jgi:hypothetical protein